MVPHLHMDLAAVVDTVVLEATEVVPEVMEVAVEATEEVVVDMGVKAAIAAVTVVEVVVVEVEEVMVAAAVEVCIMNSISLVLLGIFLAVSLI